MPTSIGPIKIY